MISERSVVGRWRFSRIPNLNLLIKYKESTPINLIISLLLIGEYYFPY